FLATTIDVECIFSQGRLLLSHIRSRLSVQSTCTLLCLGAWCQLGLVKSSEIKEALHVEAVGGENKLPAKGDGI
ncbi:hypothetical protein EI94DRAFT_1591625, partial [Lactarius quietus]